MRNSNPEFDAILFVSFGGPEGTQDVIPFLENVTRGRNVPAARLQEVAHHYYEFDGKSPINDQNRALIAATQAELAKREIALPIYFGNRNWHPFLADAVSQIKAAGHKNVLAFFTSLFSSYSGCRQYRENITAAVTAAEATDIQISKIRMGFNHPGFIESVAELTCSAIACRKNSEQLPTLVFTAHSIPLAMAKNCDYQMQLKESARLVVEQIAKLNSVAPSAIHWELAYQSRSGPPTVPWLEPDINAVIKSRASEGVSSIAVIPLGFTSDHMEIIYDLDHEAAATANEAGMEFFRVPTVGTHPKFVEMIVDLIIERMNQQQKSTCERKALGELGAWHDSCPVDCCLL